MPRDQGDVLDWDPHSVVHDNDGWIAAAQIVSIKLVPTVYSVPASRERMMSGWAKDVVQIISRQSPQTARVQLPSHRKHYPAGCRSPCVDAYL